ncbi:hypothetical protein BDZ94DRAFT_1256222, partial [Collybia nuda]
MTSIEAGSLKGREGVIVIARQDHDCKLSYKPSITSPRPTITNRSHRLQIRATRQSLHL